MEVINKSVLKKKKILLLCDDIRMPSGVGTMGKEMVINTAHKYDWINLGAGIQHPEVGKRIDISQAVNTEAGIIDANVQIIPWNGYGDAQIIRQLLYTEKPDAIMIFTDPRYWIWLFELEREIRSRIPIIYLNIWDNFPAPFYNRTFYESVDSLLAISKQTKLINELVLGEKSKDKVIKYVPHGVNSKYFYPINRNHSEYKDLMNFRNTIIPKKDIEFVVFFNSRNIRRKSPGDLVLAYVDFCERIGPEKAKKSCMIMHTETVSNAGTDLPATVRDLSTNDYVNIYFSSNKISAAHMNYLYNIADVTALISCNEGWGLSLTESMMAGTMVVANVTGGMQDQLRFEDSNGKWFEPTPEIPSNHRGTFNKCGEWAIPVFPTTRTLVGSPLTPYIFEDHVQFEDVSKALLKAYTLTKEERDQRGLKGHEWVTSEEAMMTAQNMGKNIINGIEETFRTFKPRVPFEIIKIQDLQKETLNHKITDY